MLLSEDVLRTWRIVILLGKSWSEPTQFILHSPYFLIQSIVLPILRLLVYVWCYKIDNREYCVQQTRQEYPKQSLYPTIRQSNSFISWHHIRHIIEMVSEDFYVFILRNFLFATSWFLFFSEALVLWLYILFFWDWPAPVPLYLLFVALKQ